MTVLRLSNVCHGDIHSLAMPPPSPIMTISSSPNEFPVPEAGPSMSGVTLSSLFSHVAIIAHEMGAGVR